MNVVSFATATLVLAGNLSAPRQEIAAAITPTPLSQFLTEGALFHSATRMNAPTILRDAATTHNANTTSLSAQSWSSEGPQMSKREVKTNLHEQLALFLTERER